MITMFRIYVAIFLHIQNLYISSRLVLILNTAKNILQREGSHEGGPSGIQAPDWLGLYKVKIN